MAALDKFRAAFEAVRLAVRDRRVAPDEPLVVETLAQRLRMSPTPLREALACLAGQGLIERQGRGYRVRRLEPGDITELYALHLAYVRLALQRGVGQAPDTASEAAPAGGDYRDRVEAFWRAMILGDDQRRLEMAFAGVADQLAVVRVVEPLVFADAEAELEALRGPWRHGELEALEAAAVRYHVRRQDAAKLLSAESRWSLKRSQI